MSRRYSFVSVVACVAGVLFAASAETWTWTGLGTWIYNNSGYKDWRDGANWLDSKGVAGTQYPDATYSPDDGDFLVFNDATYAHCYAPKNGSYGGIVFTNFYGGSYGSHIPIRDGGYVRYCTSGTMVDNQSFYCNGTMEFYVASSLYVAVHFNNGTGTIRKTGPGELRLGAPNANFKVDTLRLEAGVLGTFKPNDVNAGDALHALKKLIFAGDDVTVNLNGLNQTSSMLVTEENGVTGHKITSLNPACLTLEGNQDDLAFSGKVSGKASICWNPTGGAKTLTFSGGANDTTGTLTVSNGVIALAAGTTFSNAKFDVEGGQLKFGATTSLASGCVTVNGAVVCDGTYTGSGPLGQQVEWLVGDQLAVIGVGGETGESAWNCTGDQLTMPFDFGAVDPDEVNPARIFTEDILSYPETGLIVLTNVTALAGVPPIEGDYPILIGSSGGEGLSNWTLRLDGDWNGIAVTPVVASTGLVVRIAQAETTGGDLTVIRPWTNTVNRVVGNLRVLADWTLAPSTTVTLDSSKTTEFGCGESLDVTVHILSNATLVTSSKTAGHTWRCGGDGGRARFVLEEKSSVKTDATVIPESAALGEGTFDFITLYGRSSFASVSLASANAGTVGVVFCGGSLLRTAFDRRFFDCTNPEGRIVFRAVDSQAIELNLGGQRSYLTPQKGMLEFAGNGGVIFTGGGGYGYFSLSSENRSQILWNQTGGVHFAGNSSFTLTSDDAVPLARVLSLDGKGSSVNFAGYSSDIRAILGLGALSNSAARVSVVRFGADGKDVSLVDVIPEKIVGSFVFRKEGSGELVADKPFAAGLELAAGSLRVTGGSREDPVVPTTIAAAEGTSIVVDGGVLVIPDSASLPVGLRVRCRNGGLVKRGTSGEWVGRRGIQVVAYGTEPIPEPEPVPDWPQDGTTAWRSVGPGGGGWIQLVQPSIHSATRFMVGTDVAGFFISEDGGCHYEMRNTGLGEMWVETIAEHPTDPDTLILGGRSLYKSTDRGRTWIEKRTGLPAPKPTSFACFISRVLYDPDDASRVYASVGNYRKVSGFDDQHLYLSEDAGETWREIVAEGQFPVGAYILDMLVDPRNGKRLIASTAKGIYVSTDGGVHWSASNTGLPSHLRTRGIAMAPSNPDILFVTLQQKPGEKPYSGGVYKSTDGGASWEAKMSGLDQRTGSAGTGDMNCAGYGRVAIDPLDPSVVYIGGSTWWTKGIWKTTDGGDHWTQNSFAELDPQGWLPSGSPTITTLAISPLGAHSIYYGNDFAVWRSEDGGFNLRQCYTDPQPDGTFASVGFEIICGTQVVPDPHQRGRFYLGYLDVGAFVTTNNGASLVRNTMPRDLSCFSMALAPKESGLVWGTFGSDTDARRRIMVSRDGLQSWEPTIAEGDEPDWLTAKEHSIVCLNDGAPYRLVCMVEGWGVATSSDGGARWKLVDEEDFPDTKNVVSLKGADGALYAAVRATGLHHGRLWKSVDYGESWVCVTDESMRLGSVNDVHVEGSRILLSVRENYSSQLNLVRPGGCWLSEDAGATWRCIHAGAQIFSAVFAGKWIAVACSNDGYYDHFSLFAVL